MRRERPHRRRAADERDELAPPHSIISSASTIPIVFATGLDPIASGLVSNLNRPGGNLTGFTSRLVEAYAKPLELLHDLLPAVTTFGVLLNPGYPSAEVESKGLQEVARILGL